MAERRNEKYSLTSEDFDGLLAALNSDSDRAGQMYQDIRDHLIRIFVWRGCSEAEDYADETINRVARKLSTGEKISDLPTYCFGVGRMLLKEFRKKQVRNRRALEQLNHDDKWGRVEANEEELRRSCLEECLQKQSEADQEMILSYYNGDKRDKIENRKRLAARLNLSVNTLRMKALRLREKLEGCVVKCTSNREF